MRLLLFHPGAASVTCEECRKYIYDDTWKRKTYRAGPRREERPCLRPDSIPTPCERCPKESPSKAKEYDLSRRNRKAFDAYLRFRAAGPRGRIDSVAERNMAIIDDLYREWERKAIGREIAMRVSELLAKVL